jgi:hypothetical protein
MRLQSLVYFAKTSNPTWVNLSISRWSTIEINVGIICACMPNLRLLLVLIFPKLLGTTQQSNDRYYATHSQSHRGGNISATRPAKSGPSSQQEGSAAGIKYSQTYTVQWGEHDETKLIQMGDLEAEAMKSSSGLSENEL